MLVRVFPLALFILVTALQGKLGESSKYWCYFTKSILGIWLVLGMRPLISEMRWKLSWESVVVGVGVCVMWVGIDPYSSHLGGSTVQWNPHEQFGKDSGLAWFFIITRILCSTILVPPLEEVFYRSFLYRYVVSQDFLSVPFSRFHPLAFIVAAAIFGLSHQQWVAGILCAFAYQWLAIRKNRLGDSMTAHAITNLLLGIYVAWRGAWQFW